MSLDDTLSEIALFKKETTYYVLILHYNYSRNVCGVLLSRKVFDCEKCTCTLGKPSKKKVWIFPTPGGGQPQIHTFKEVWIFRGWGSWVKFPHFF